MAHAPWYHRRMNTTKRDTYTLTDDLAATFIHGKTGQEVSDDTLEAGRTVELEGPASVGFFGEERVLFLVDGYRYRAVAADFYRKAQPANA